MKHEITRTRPQGGLGAYCACGASVESSGRDESSRGSVAAWIAEHEKEQG